MALSGFTAEDLAASAKGTMHFDWTHGAIAAAPDVPVPPVLNRFRQWTADAEIAKGNVTLKENEVWQGARKSAVDASISFGDPPRMTFAAPKRAQAAKR